MMVFYSFFSKSLNVSIDSIIISSRFIFKRRVVQDGHTGERQRRSLSCLFLCVHLAGQLS